MSDEQMGFAEADVRTLFVVWLRRGKFEAKPFTGSESWDDIAAPDSFGEECSLVAARSKEDAERLIRDRCAVKFPQVYVQR